MSDSKHFTNQLINDSIYSKYLDEIKEYYTMKKKYTQYKKSIINKIISSDESIDNKRKTLSKQKFKCINCGKIGGTLFKETNIMLQATCGNPDSPCELNLDIVKMNSVNLEKELNKLNYLLINTKKNIVITKLDFLFNYIAEDKAVELFNVYKTELDTHQENYNEIFLIYNSITDNSEINELLNNKIAQQNNLISEYKDFISLYKTTNQTELLKEAVNLYLSKLVDINNEVLKLKYRHTFIEYENDENQNTINRLVQDKYNITDLEVIKKPE